MSQASAVESTVSIVPKKMQREPFFRNDIVRTVFKLDIEQFLTFQAPALTKSV
jgi:phenylalanine-4-hydroxylase